MQNFKSNILGISLAASFLMIVIFSSCRKDFDTILSSGELSFSKDTVFLDTVFTNIGSSTYKLKVYNNSGNDISIPELALARGQNSMYRLNVDGEPGKTFEDIEILANDSIYVFIETTINYDEITDPIYKDSIRFSGDGKIQYVKLITLTKDAVFLFPSKDSQGVKETINIGIDEDGNDVDVTGFYLEDNELTFTNEKPYVIYGYCAVPEGKTLTIEAGANIHFHSNSGLIVNEDATLIVEGELDNEVIFEGDRLEPSFSDVPGQWGVIWLREGSENHDINYAIIKNGSAGIICDAGENLPSPVLNIRNTQIYNNSNFGILGRETNIKGENLVINNSGQASLACIIGGTYNFTHCTFANYWSSSQRQFPSVFVNNYFSYIEGSQTIIETRDLVEANFSNCIIEGSNRIELMIDKVEAPVFNYFFENSLIRFNDSSNLYSDIEEYNFEDTNHYIDNIFNGNPDFKEKYENELIIGEDSDANGKSNSQGTVDVPIDIMGVTRETPADIGAYQHIIFEDD